MPAIWILVADGARARLFALHEEHPPEEVQSFVNAEGRLPGRALRHDRAPTTHDRYGHGRHAIEPHTSPRDKALARFAVQLRDALERGRVEHRYDSLVLIAPPRFLGMLHATLDKHLRACVALEIGKDMTRDGLGTIGAALIATLARTAPRAHAAA